MRRKPAIIVLLVLLLSIGGAVTYHHLTKVRKPAFTDVDTFLRNFPETGGWKFQYHKKGLPHLIYRGGRWKRYLGMEYEVLFEWDEYRFIDDRKGDRVPDDRITLSVLHRKGVVDSVMYGYARIPVDEKTFHDRFLGKFPSLQAFYANP